MTPFLEVSHTHNRSPAKPNRRMVCPYPAILGQGWQVLGHLGGYIKTRLGRHYQSLHAQHPDILECIEGLRNLPRPAARLDTFHGDIVVMMAVWQFFNKLFSQGALNDRNCILGVDAAGERIAKSSVKGRLGERTSGWNQTNPTPGSRTAHIRIYEYHRPGSLMTRLYGYFGTMLLEMLHASCTCTCVTARLAHILRTSVSETLVMAQHGLRLWLLSRTLLRTFSSSKASTLVISGP